MRRIHLGKVAAAATLLAMMLFRYLSFLWVQRVLGGVLLDELVILDGVANPEPGARFVVELPTGVRSDHGASNGYRTAPAHAESAASDAGSQLTGPNTQ